MRKSVRNSKKTELVSMTTMNLLKLFREIVVVNIIATWLQRIEHHNICTLRECQCYFFYIRQVSASDNFRRARWLMFMDSSTSVEEFFAGIHIPFDSEFLVAQWSAQRVQLSLTELYRVHYASPLQTFCIGNWTYNGGLSWSSVPFFTRRKDLKGIAIKAAVIPYVRTF